MPAPLNLAAGTGNFEEVERLLAKGGVDVNYKGWNGNTPLISAAGSGHTQVAHLLFLSGADVHAINNDGITAAHLARQIRANKSQHNHPVLAACLDQLATPPNITLDQPHQPQQPQQPHQLDLPPTVHWLLAGVPLHPDPQPAWHVHVHHEGLLLTVIGPWICDVALPLAATHPEMKELIFTLISHLYDVCLTNAPIADRFFNEFAKPAAQRMQDAMPAQMHARAQRLGVDYALAPTELRDTPDHKVELNQSQYLAFMHPDHLHVAEEVLAESMQKFVAMRREAEAAVADFADPNKGPFVAGNDTGHSTTYSAGMNVGYSTTYAKAHVHSLPTLPEVMVAALCIVSTFILAHLQTTRPDLCSTTNDDDGEHGGSSSGDGSVSGGVGSSKGGGSTDKTGGCNGSNDSSTDSSSSTDHVQLILWPGVKTMLRMLAKLREDYADLDVPWGALIDTVRFSLTTTRIDDHANFVKQFLPEGVNLNDYNSAAGSPTKKRRVERHADNSLAVVRAKSTMDDPTAAVKQELWNLLYTPDGLTFATMLGEGGLEEVQGADRWEEYGDVGLRTTNRHGTTIKGAAEKNLVTTHQPRNLRFQAALAAAKQANPTISAYVWEPALQLLAHPTFARHAVAMVIEVQLYIDQFLQFRKLVHCYYKITRAPNLASLVQDCRKYAKNPALAFDTQKQVDTDAAAAAAALLAVVEADDVDGIVRHAAPAPAPAPAAVSAMAAPGSIDA